MNVSNAGADANTTTNTNKIIVATIVDTNANINDEHAVTDVGTNAIADASTIGVDRLISELKLSPPKDAYHKLRLTLKVINTQISAAGDVQVVDPVAGNVLFC
ncbi:hypothetical protein JHK85_006853 [Glycine max]|nr:hypothetical protein JHK85_006853 [Glycine max]KAG5071447.1 hypothetical protein JHK86_006658 [Glycine max]